MANVPTPPSSGTKSFPPRNRAESRPQREGKGDAKPPCSQPRYSDTALGCRLPTLSRTKAPEHPDVIGSTEHRTHGRALQSRNEQRGGSHGTALTIWIRPLPTFAVAASGNKRQQMLSHPTNNVIGNLLTRGESELEEQKARGMPDELAIALGRSPL